MKTTIDDILDNLLYWDTCPEEYKEIIREHQATQAKAEEQSGEEKLFLVTYRHKNRTDASIHEDTVSAIDYEEAVTKVCANHNFEVEWHMVKEINSTPPVTPQDEPLGFIESSELLSGKPSTHSEVGETTYKCDMCEADQVIEHKQVFKHEWYTPPSGCTDGDYWNHGYYYILCECGRRIEIAEEDAKKDVPVPTREQHPGVCPLKPQLTPTKPVDITEYDTGNTAWPFKDVLTKLVEASDILLHKRDYDGHGWEEHELCFRLAKAILTKLNQ